MKKKRLIFIIFVLLLPQISALEQKELYSGTVYPGENATIDNKTFTFNLGSTTDKISIVTPSGGVIVTQGECTIKDFFNICFDGTELWYHNYTLDKDYFKAKVSVSEILPKIEITRTIENDEPLIDKETRIDVIFKNTGDRDATNVIYKDDFPSEFVISEVTNCRIGGNGVRWYGTLTTNLEKICSYNVKASNKTTFSSNAVVQYNKGDKIETVNSTIIKIKVPDYQLNISTSLPSNIIEMGDKTNFTIILKNINSEKNIQVTSFKINIPIGLKVPYVVKNMRQDFNKYTWSGTLTQEDKSVKFFFEKIKAERTGYYDLVSNVAFLIDNVRKEIKIVDRLKVRGIGEEIEEVEEIVEESSADINLSTDDGEDVIEEEIMVETEKINVTITMPSEENASEEKEEDIKTIEKDSIIKKLFNNIYFIILDAIIISIIIIMVMKMIKGKRAQ